MEPIDHLQAFMTLWEKPSFEVHRSWTIYTSDYFTGHSVPERVAVRRLTAPHRHLNEKEAQLLRNPEYEISSPGPYAIRVSQAEVPVDRFLTLINWGKSFTIPIWGIDSIDGLDGTSYAMELWPESDPIIRLEWWEGFPREWSPLIQWAGEIISFLESCLRQSSP